MTGKLQGVVFKTMALASALGIGGGYVLWRQSESDEANERIEHARAEKKVEELTFMVGSKNPGRSLISEDDILVDRNDFLHPIPGIPAGADEVSNIKTRLLPGSKSLGTVFSVGEVDRATIEDQIKARDRRTGADVILPLPVESEAERPEEKLPKLLPGSKSAPFELRSGQ